MEQRVLFYAALVPVEVDSNPINAIEVFGNNGYTVLMNEEAKPSKTVQPPLNPDGRPNFGTGFSIVGTRVAQERGRRLSGMLQRNGVFRKGK